MKPQGDGDASLASALLTGADVQLINPQNIPQLGTLDRKGQKTSKVSWFKEKKKGEGTIHVA